MNNDMNNDMNDNTTNGEFILQHFATRERKVSLVRMDFGTNMQFCVAPGCFLIAPERDFSLVSEHSLAGWNIEFQKWPAGSKQIGHVVTPSGRDVLAIGLLRAEVDMRVYCGGVNNIQMADFKGVISFLVYQEHPCPEDGIFSMGWRSLECCRGWNRKFRCIA